MQVGVVRVLREEGLHRCLVAELRQVHMQPLGGSHDGGLGARERAGRAGAHDAGVPVARECAKLSAVEPQRARLERRAVVQQVYGVDMQSWGSAAASRVWMWRNALPLLRGVPDEGPAVPDPSETVAPPPASPSSPHPSEHGRAVSSDRGSPLPAPSELEHRLFPPAGTPAG